jgi:5-amino-6-(5-phosphoribosylamino)uracil reductase
MKTLPYIIVNCAISLDGYIDDESNKRLLLSNNKDFERVDALRARCDAIMVGANTIRKDNPRLLIRSKKQQQERIKQGMLAHPVKVTVTETGNMPEKAAFFALGDTKKYVYTTAHAREKLTQHIGNIATVISLKSKNLKIQDILADLSQRGIQSILVEGGTTMLSQLLQEGLADELHIAIAPFFVGEKNAPRVVHSGSFYWNAMNRMKLVSTKKLDDVVILTYMDKDAYWLRAAIDLSKQCPQVDTAFAVGAIIVNEEGKIITQGYSRETDPKMHAEESALDKLRDKHIDLTKVTLYSSLEPCNQRLSRSKGCTQLIRESGITRVVFAATEPTIFVPGKGNERLQKSEITTRHMPQFTQEVIEKQSPFIQKKWLEILR